LFFGFANCYIECLKSYWISRHGVGLDGGSSRVFCCRSYLKTTPCVESSNWEFAVEDSFCGIILMVGESGREWLRVLCLLSRKPGKEGYLKVKIGANQLLLSL
jgi:hypothetical protein